MKLLPTKIQFLIIGCLLVTGIVLLVIRYTLASFQPVLHPELFVSDAASYLHPEIELPLYLLSIIVIPFGGYGLYLMFKLLTSGISDITLASTSGVLVRVSILLQALLLWVLIRTSLPFTTIAFGYVFLIFFLIYTVRLLQGFYTVVFPIVRVFFDVAASAGFLIYALWVVFKIFYTNFFSSPEVVSYLQRYEGFYYFYGLSSIWQFMVTMLVLSGVLWLVFFRTPIVHRFFHYRVITFGLDIVAIIAIIFIISIIMPWESKNWRGISDYAGVIGVVNDILGGKTILVNSYSQYGLLMPYALSLTFRIIPLSYYTFFQLNYVTMILGYISIYLALRFWFRNQVIPLVWLFFAPQIHYFAQQTNLLFFGMLTFFRFGWWIVILLYFLTSENVIKQKNIRLCIELLLVSVGVFWGFDTGIYILLSYITYIFVRDIQEANNFHRTVKSICVSMFLLVSSLFITFLIIHFASYIRAGQSPDWGEFIHHTSRFAKNGFGLGPMPLVSTHIGVIIFHLGFSVYIIYTLFDNWGNKLQKERYLPLIGFLTAYASFQLFYYIGESVIGNMHTVILPTTILFFWFLNRVRELKLLKGIIRLHPIEKITLILCAVAFFLSVSLWTTISLINIHTIYQRRGPVAYYPNTEYVDGNMKQSVNWLKEHLQNIPPYERKIAIISIHDYVFLVETKSTNIIDSGNLQYFGLKTQMQMLCNQLYDRNPQSLFMENEPMWWVQDLIECAKKKYHYVQNIGYLNIWERNK